LIVGVTTLLSVAAVLTAVRLVSDDRASLNYPLVVGVGLVEGLVLGVIVAYLWGRLAGRLGRTSDVEAATGLKVLGVVPAMRLHGADRVAATADHPVVGAQAYGIVAAELADTLRESTPTCLLVTSPTRGDGRTTTAVNLATLLAAEGLQVALLSADPSGEGVDEVLELERQPGLTEVLAGSSPLDSALQPGGVERLRVMTAGGPSKEMLAKSLDKLARLLDRLTRDVDLVVIDAPPILGGLEAMLLAQDVDLVLLVVDVRHGKRSDAATAVAHLEHVQDRLAGVVANDPGPRRSRTAPVAEPAEVPDISPEPAAATGMAAVGPANTTTGSARRAARAVRRHPWASAIATAAAVALMISVVWWLSSDRSTKAEDGPNTSDTSLAVTASSGQAAVAGAMHECRSTWDARAEPLGAAATSSAQWQPHVVAMNGLYRSGSHLSEDSRLDIPRFGQLVVTHCSTTSNGSSAASASRTNWPISVSLTPPWLSARTTISSNAPCAPRYGSFSARSEVRTSIAG
jgi:capsular exopolysaccharide synthesis family protein